MIEGHCDPRFDRVARAFELNFQQHEELGAVVAITQGGELVVDLGAKFVYPSFVFTDAIEHFSVFAAGLEPGRRQHRLFCLSADDLRYVMRVGVSLPVREMENDLGAIKAFAQLAEELGLTHLRVPEQILRPGNGHLHESMMLLAYIAAVTEKIELVPSVVMLPARQTVLFAKQAAELDILSGGRVRIGIGVGTTREEYDFLGENFKTRGRRCDEQIRLLKELWTREEVNFAGEFDQVSGAGLNPLPIQRPIPLWVGARSVPSAPVARRIGRQCDGWFVLCGPEEFPGVRDSIASEATAAGRSPNDIGMEAGVAVVGPREAEWQDRVSNWRRAGLTHLCLRTLGGGLKVDEHVKKLSEVVPEIPES